MKQVQEILKWGKQFTNLDLLIEASGINFIVKVDRNVLPHLLGLHYINSSSSNSNINGIRLFNKVRREKMTDEEIYEKIKNNHPEQLENVKNRIHYFKEFMFNLDKARIVEMTNPQTKIKSHYLILRSVDEKYLQLGIAKGDIIDYFETFIVRKNDDYFHDTTVSEKISGIYRYDEECNPIPFSFNPEKAKKLEREYHEKKKESDQTDDKKIKDSHSFGYMDEDERDFEI